MKRKLLITVLVCVLLAAGTGAILTLLPKSYLVHESLVQTTVFWNDKEAFVFVDTFAFGKAQNAVERKIASSRWGWLIQLSSAGFTTQQRSAYHLLASGGLDSPKIPADAGRIGTWELVEGKLQFTTYANRYSNLPGFRWAGEKFIPIPAKTLELTPDAELNPDSTEDADDSEGGPIGKAQRKSFKAAGWQWKLLNGYEARTGKASLPIQLGDSKFQLILESKTPDKRFDSKNDFLDVGATQLQLSGDSLPGSATLWHQNGWQEISKAEYEGRMQHGTRGYSSWRTVWLWLLVILGLFVWKIWAWIRVIHNFATVKGRVVKNMATYLAFPPALPSQFPQLDTAALERHTREFENMGFTRLIDTSPTSDSPTHPSLFCRLMVHTGNHCYGEIRQIFPRGKAPMEMRCAISSHLQNGWSLGFSNQKPLAASSLIRRPKALGVSMPDASPAELLQSLLTLRQQVCLDLGIAPLTEDSLESYIAKAQQSIVDMRTAVKQKNFATALPQYYYRKLALGKTKPEYVWLGEYPKEAEQRKQGYNMAPVG